MSSIIIFLLRTKSQFLRFFSLDDEQKTAKKFVVRKNYKIDGKVILVEAWQTPWNQLGISLFLPVFIERYGGSPINYYMTQKSLWFEFKQKVRQFFSISRKYGVKKIIFFGPTKRKNDYYRKLATKLLTAISSPEEFEKLSYKNIRIGDLVYDQYLRAATAPTVNLSDSLLLEKLAQLLCYCDELDFFFEHNEVSCVLVSHTVYSLGLPARLASERGIKSFQVTGESIYQIGNGHTHAYVDFKDYKNKFRLLPNDLKEYAYVESEKRMLRRINGEVGVDMPYSTASAYSNIDDRQSYINTSHEIRILIAVHDFYDSPHAYGDNLFPDFYIWLEHLAKISQKTNYGWYIKTHPDVIGNGESVLTEFIQRHNNFILLPKDISHSQILNQGINVVLTIFGTISSEYAYLGKLAINASQNNPHISYEFSVSPKTIDEYDSILVNLPSIIRNHKINRKDIFEFYYMHNIRRLKSWMIKDVSVAISDLENYRNISSWKIFNYFYSSANVIPIEKIQNALKLFINSNDYVLELHHFDENI